MPQPHHTKTHGWRRDSHELRKFLLHFLLDVCIVLHLGEQRFGGGGISWWGRELAVKNWWLTARLRRTVSSQITKTHRREEEEDERAFPRAVWVGYLWAGQRLSALSSLSASLQVRGRQVSVQQTTKTKSKSKRLAVLTPVKTEREPTDCIQTLQCVTAIVHSGISTSERQGGD